MSKNDFYLTRKPEQTWVFGFLSPFSFQPGLHNYIYSTFILYSNKNPMAVNLQICQKLLKFKSNAMADKIFKTIFSGHAMGQINCHQSKVQCNFCPLILSLMYSNMCVLDLPIQTEAVHASSANGVLLAHRQGQVLCLSFPTVPFFSLSFSRSLSLSRAPHLCPAFLKLSCLACRLLQLLFCPRIQPCTHLSPYNWVR